MFTGLIQLIGKVASIRTRGEGSRCQINGAFNTIDIGASVAINGVCSTVVSYTDNEIVVDYLPETLKKTTFSELKEGTPVNIERSLRYGDEMGGHMVTGHVDTVGSVREITQCSDSYKIVIGYDVQFAQYLIPKGSIAVDGISLTVVMDDITNTETFEVHIIPHTWESTILHHRLVGDKVNLEFDQIGKYLVRQKVV